MMKNIIERLFTGRTNRVTYVVGIAIFVFPTEVVSLILGGANNIFLAIIYTCLIIVIFPFAFSLHIRRLHDLNHSGWFLLLFIIPLVNIIGFLLLLLLPGQGKNNQYGSKPKTGINGKSLFGLIK